MTTPSPASAPVDNRRDEAIALAEATFSEGFCPFCGGRLSPLSDYDAERTQNWYAPPTAACLACELMIGRANGGVHGCTLHHLDQPFTSCAEISPYIDTTAPEAQTP